MPLPKGTIEVKNATIDRFAKLWHDNFMANKKSISSAFGVSRFFNRFQGIPSIVVGAGPSLDKNIKFLHAVKDKAVIIACDAAFKILKEEGINPHFVGILDPQDHIIDFLYGDDARGVVLIAPTIVHPKVLHLWNGKLLFYNKFAPDIPLLKQIEAAAKPLGSLTPGGSVLSICYDFAFKCGSDPIIFIGQDLSYKDESAYSKKGVYSSYKTSDIISKEHGNITTEKDIFGGQVLSLNSMHVTAGWFKWAFSSWKRNNPLHIINSTEGGILKDGCDIIPLSEALYRYCKKDINIHWQIKKILN